MASISLFFAAQGALSEQHGLGEPHHVFQQWRVGRETLQNAGHLRPAEVFAELCIQSIHFRWRICLADYGKVRCPGTRSISRLCRRLFFGRQLQSELQSL